MDASSSLPSSLLPISSSPVLASPSLDVSFPVSLDNLDISKERVVPSPPLLPTELKREILRFCDPSTLVQTSLVSLEFLELSTPVLYYEVFLKDVFDLAKMFCARDERSQPQLEPYLSLEHVKHLSYNSIYPSSFDILQPTTMHMKPNGLILDRVTPFPPSPTTPRRRLKLDSLTIRIQHSDSNISQPSVSHFFNPLHVTVQEIPLGRARRLEDRLPSFPVKGVLVRWTRLRSFTIKQIQPSRAVTKLLDKMVEFETIHDFSPWSLTMITGPRTWTPLRVLVKEGLKREALRRGHSPVVLKMKVRVLVDKESERVALLEALREMFTSFVGLEEWVSKDPLESLMDDISVEIK